MYYTKVGIITRIDLEYELQIGKVFLSITRDEAHRLAVENLEDEDLVWNINTKKGDFFFNEHYPEWSLVPNPKDWVAGNIYYNYKKDAENHLTYLIEKEIKDVRKRCEDEIANLELHRW